MPLRFLFFNSTYPLVLHEANGRRRRRRKNKESTDTFHYRMEPLTSCGISPTVTQNHTKRFLILSLFFCFVFFLFHSLSVYVSSRWIEEEEQWSRGYHTTHISFELLSFICWWWNDVPFFFSYHAVGNGRKAGTLHHLASALLTRMLAFILALQILFVCEWMDRVFAHRRDCNHSGLCAHFYAG